MPTFDLDRRGLIGGLAAVPLAARAAPAAAAPAQQVLVAPQPDATGMVRVTLQVNGQAIPMTIEPRRSLLDALRDSAGLTGTKKGCDHGACGACTVHVDGKRVLACLTLAARCEGHPVTTIEGLARDGALHPMQAAFVHHDGYQCGYCTPGQIMSAVALVQEGHAGSPDEIRAWMSGNICRCGAYNNIVAAISDASTSKAG